MEVKKTGFWSQAVGPHFCTFSWAAPWSPPWWRWAWWTVRAQSRDSAAGREGPRQMRGLPGWANWPTEPVWPWLGRTWVGGIVKWCRPYVCVVVGNSVLAAWQPFIYLLNTRLNGKRKTKNGPYSLMSYMQIKNACTQNNMYDIRTHINEMISIKQSSMAAFEDRWRTKGRRGIRWNQERETRRQ